MHLTVPTPTDQVKETDVRDWIMAKGEKEPNGSRYRVLYRALLEVRRGSVVSLCDVH
jgi:hypothetical protein